MAFSVRCFPSKVKGLVTIATVKAPESFAILATTGAAPVPVPFPIPAAIKTISAPATTFLMVSMDCSAAIFPTDGSPPAPRPLVVCLPKMTRFGALDEANACLSVFIT